MADQYIRVSPSGKLAVHLHTEAGAPTVNDDRSTGFPIFSEWIDNTNPLVEVIYVLVDDTPTAAVWVPYAAGAGGSSVGVAQQVLQFGINDAIPDNTTTLLSPAVDNTPPGTAFEAMQLAGRAGTGVQIGVRHGVAGTSVQDATYTVLVNGVATAVTVAQGNNDITYAESAVIPLVVAKGSQISVNVLEPLLVGTAAEDPRVIVIIS